MNWEKIKKKYPKAHKEFGIWADKDGQYCDIDLEYLWIFEPAICKTLNHVYYNDRDLYDFFDERGIMIEIKPPWAESESDFWDFDIIFDGIDDFLKPHWKNRIEVEKAAFLKALEILEDKLDK